MQKYFCYYRKYKTIKNVGEYINLCMSMHDSIALVNNIILPILTQSTTDM